MSNWNVIIAQIKDCRNQRDHVKVIACLENLFRIYNDGMVAFAIAEEYEKIGNLDGAIRNYEFAFDLFPLPEYKNRARVALDRIRLSEHPNEKKQKLIEAEESDPIKAAMYPIELADYDPESALFLVSCTKHKIWDLSPIAPDYLPARSAYKGQKFVDFVSWAEEVELETNGFSWIILSAKYGFIESWHPISNYDVTFIDERTYPIADDTLISQVQQQRFWRTRDDGIIKLRLAKFNSILAMSCPPIYLDKLRISFPNAEIQSF